MEEEELTEILREAFGDTSSDSDSQSPPDGKEETAEELKAVLNEAFGDSSSDSDGGPSDYLRRRLEIVDSQSIFGDQQIWEPIVEINGLWICRDFLSVDQQFSLLSAMKKEGYVCDGSQNQAMRFGDLPDWAIELSICIRQNVALSGCFSESTNLPSNGNTKETCLFPAELLWREPLFNQLIVNTYQPGEGIRAHIDLMRFEDGIAIISLESSCVMHFSSAAAELKHPEEVNQDYVPSAKIPVQLTSGSLILMSGEARYLWKHEINRKPGFQNWQGQDIEQKRRTSITLRKLCQTD